MTLKQHYTHVNDIPVTINNWVDINGRTGETTARRLATELERGADCVRRVENAPIGTDVWIDTPDGDMVRYPTPDGYAVRHISHFDDGTICVTYVEVDDA